MSGWENFFIAEVGASAALAGLVFVGISINLTRIMAITGLPERALEALIVLAAVLIMASLLLVPGQPPALIGVEVLVFGLIDWLLVITILVNYLGELESQYWRQFALRVILSQIATLPFVIAGAVLLIWGNVGPYWLVPAVIFSFILALHDAWVLLIEINR